MKEDKIQTNNILQHQGNQLNGIDFDPTQLDSCINDSEALLRSLGKADKIEEIKAKHESTKTEWQPLTKLVLPDWQSLCEEANTNLSAPVESITQLFTDEELAENRIYIEKLNQDFNDLHKLDSVDITISAVAGIIAGALDILLVGIPGPSPEGVKGGPLSNYIRAYFEKVLPPEKWKN